MWWWKDRTHSEAQWTECVVAERLLSVFSCSWNVPLCVRVRYITAACGGRMRILCLSFHPTFLRVQVSLICNCCCCMCVPGFFLNQLWFQLLMLLSAPVGGCWKSLKSDSYVWGNTDHFCPSPKKYYAVLFCGSYIVDKIYILCLCFYVEMQAVL